MRTGKDEEAVDAAATGLVRKDSKQVDEEDTDIKDTDEAPKSARSQASAGRISLSSAFR